MIVGPLVVEYNEETPRTVFVFPLQSWYHSGFDSEPDITHPLYLKAEEAVPFDMKWSDFRLCKWPERLISSEEFPTITKDCRKLSQAFAHLNEAFLPPIGENDHSEERKLSPFIESYYQRHPHLSDLSSSPPTVISFSHFVPRVELTPEKRFLLEPQLSKVIGSVILEEQIRRLQSHLHLFGHTHIPMDMELEDIRYIQWPLGYSR